MRVVFRRDAAADLRDIVDYYESLGLARTGDHIISAIDYSVMLRAQPGFHRAAPYHADDDTYQLTVPSFPYVVSYRVEATFIDVIGTSHTARSLDTRRHA
jgi:plasmid stabilization system protein ParE